MVADKILGNRGCSQKELSPSASRVCLGLVTPFSFIAPYEYGFLTSSAAVSHDLRSTRQKELFFFFSPLMGLMANNMNSRESSGKESLPRCC